jgi:hypothetical protein
LLNHGRLSLSAYCPHCDQALPDHIGTARLAHVPILAGASAGKTMLRWSTMVAFVEEARRGGFQTEISYETDRLDYEQMREQLGRGIDLRKTVVRAPRAFVFSIARSRLARRLVYLYDAAGEMTRSTDTAQQLSYLEHAEGLLFVVDPFSLYQVQTMLDEEGRITAARSQPSPEDAGETFDRFRNLVKSMSRREPSSLPVAVVVTKADALSHLTNLQAPPVGAEGEAVVRWLDGMGFDGINRSLKHHFGDTRYWMVSAREGGEGVAGRGSVTAPMRWLLARNGLKLPPVAPGT